MDLSLWFAFAFGVAAFVAFFAPRRMARLRRALLEHLIVITRCALPIGAGLRALADERVAEGSASARKDAQVIRGVASRYEASGSLAAAVAEAGSLLPPAQLDLLQTAERHGALPLALEVLSEEETKAVEGRWLYLEWLAYPTAVAAFVLAAGFFHSLIVVPKFAEIQRSMDIEPARVGVDIATGVLAGVLLLALTSAVISIWGLPSGMARVFQRACDLVLWRAPFRQRRHGRWMQRVAALLRSGATLPEALDGAAGLRDVGGPALERAAGQAREGQPLDVVLGTAYGPDAARFLSPTLMSAERASSLGEGLETSGKRLEARASQRLRTLAEMLKPLPIVLCGLVAATHVHAVWGGIVAIQTTMVRSVW